MPTPTVGSSPHHAAATRELRALLSQHSSMTQAEETALLDAFESVRRSGPSQRYEVTARRDTRADATKLLAESGVFARLPAEAVAKLGAVFDELYGRRFVNAMQIDPPPRLLIGFYRPLKQHALAQLQEWNARMDEYSALDPSLSSLRLQIGKTPGLSIRELGERLGAAPLP